MNSYTAAVRAYIPRTWFIRVFGVLMIAIGGGMAPFISVYVSKPHPIWFAHYMVCMVLAVMGASCGGALKRVRRWSPSILAGNLWSVMVVVASCLLLALWLVYAGILVATDGLAGITAIISLAVAMLAMMTNAGVYTRLNYLLVFSIPVVMFVPEAQKACLDAIQAPWAGWALSGIALSSWLLLLKKGATPLSDAERSSAAKLLASPLVLDQEVSTRIPRMAWMSLEPMSRQQAFAAAIEHSPAQAWLNDIAIVAFVLLITLLVFIVGARDPKALAMIISLVSALFAIVYPLLSWRIATNIGDFLWLSGSQNSKRALVFSMFFRFLRSPLRVCVVALVASLAMHGLANDFSSHPYMVALSTGILLSAPGGAAVVLAATFILGKQLEGGNGLSVIIYAIVMLVTLALGGGFAGWVSFHWDFAVAIVGVVAGSTLVAIASGLVCASWVAGRREWLN